MTGYPSIDKPWLKYYSDEAINAVLPNCSMYEYVYECNKNHLEDIAVKYFNKSFTYKRIFELIDKTANAFYNFGVKQGDIVTICSLMTPEILICIYALNKIGATVNLEYVSLSEENFKSSFISTNSKIVIALNLFSEKIFNASKNINVKKIIITNLFDSTNGITKYVLKKKTSSNIKELKNVASFYDFINEYNDNKTITPIKNNFSVILHTGGTTGKPKGVMLTNYNLNYLAMTYGNLGLGYTRGDKILHSIPPFHSYGFGIGIHTPMIQGLTVLMCPLPKLESLVKIQKKENPELMVLGVSQLNQMLDIWKDKNISISKLKIVGIGGENVPEIVENKAVNYLNNNSNGKLIVGYGMSELSSAATSNLSIKRKLGSVGIPFVNYNVKIVDEKLNELKYDEIGEICFNTPSMTNEYFNDKEESKIILKTHKDGLKWLHTGDLGYVDKDGYVFIKGRLKRIYGYIDDNGNTFKIFPDYIENCILGIKGVKNCAVGCIKDDKSINKIYSIIVKDEALSLDEIKSTIKTVLPEYNFPHIIEIVDEIPINAVGKTDYIKIEKGLHGLKLNVNK